MRLGDYRTSDNVDDQRGQSFGGGFGGGGGLPGMLIGLVASRFGIGGVLILLLGYCALSSLGGLGGGEVGVTPQQSTKGGSTAAESCAVDAASRLSCQVLASTEDVWTRTFAAQVVTRVARAGLMLLAEKVRSGSTSCSHASSRSSSLSRLRQARAQTGESRSGAGRRAAPKS